MKDIITTRSKYKDIVEDVINDLLNGIKDQVIINKYNIPERTLYSWKKKLRQAGVDTKVLALSMQNQIVSGTTTRYNADGTIHHQFIKTERDKSEMLRAMREAVDAIMSEIEPLSPDDVNGEEYVGKRDDDLLACHILTDYHIGMFVEKTKAGERWDLEEAERMLFKYIDKSCSLLPDADTGLLIQLGDFLHTDNILGVTPASGHVLDVAGSYNSICRVAIRCMRYMIDTMLKHYNNVRVIVADANHDPAGGNWLALMIDTLYENIDRVSVDNTRHPFYCYEWGDVSIFAHHGHKRNLNNISQVFASYYREIFGRTKFSYGHLGHFHHRRAIEDNLMQIEIHNTLAPRDSYAIDGGYKAQRKAKSILYHKKIGEIGTINVTPDML